MFVSVNHLFDFSRGYEFKEVGFFVFLEKHDGIFVISSFVFWIILVIEPSRF